MTIFQKAKEAIMPDEVRASIDKEAATLARAEQHQVALVLAQERYIKADNAYVEAVSVANGPADKVVIAAKQALDQAAVDIAFYTDAVRGDQVALDTIREARVSATRDKTLKIYNRLCAERAKAAQKLQTSIQLYVGAALEFYDASHRIQDAWPFGTLNPIATLTDKTGLRDAIEAEIARFNVRGATLNVIVPGQNVSPLLATRKLPPLTDRVENANRVTLNLVQAAKYQTATDAKPATAPVAKVEDNHAVASAQPASATPATICADQIPRPARQRGRMED